MANHKNFFETIKEARMRLDGTMVLYAGEPYLVYWISDHKGDGVFRIYIYPSDLEAKPPAPGQSRHLPSLSDFSYLAEGNKELIGQKIDEWMEKNPNGHILRKSMDSSYFNKFRPFPLGMINGQIPVYVERHPTRRSEQGLTANALDETVLKLSSSGGGGRRSGYVNISSTHFAEMVRGNYPTAQEVLDNLLDTKVVEYAAGFNRLFALIRGPVETIFLCYKGEVVGKLPFNNFETVQLRRECRHLVEVTQELNLFGHVGIIN